MTSKRRPPKKRTVDAFCDSSSSSSSSFSLHNDDDASADVISVPSSSSAFSESSSSYSSSNEAKSLGSPCTPNVSMSDTGGELPLSLSSSAPEPFSTQAIDMHTQRQGDQRTNSTSTDTASNKPLRLTRAPPTKKAKTAEKASAEEMPTRKSPRQRTPTSRHTYDEPAIASNKTVNKKRKDSEDNHSAAEAVMSDSVAENSLGNEQTSGQSTEAPAKKARSKTQKHLHDVANETSEPQTTLVTKQSPVAAISEIINSSDSGAKNDVAIITREQKNETCTGTADSEEKEDSKIGDSREDAHEKFSERSLSTENQMHDEQFPTPESQTMAQVVPSNNAESTTSAIATKDKENMEKVAPTVKRSSDPANDVKKKKKLTFQDQVFQHMMLAYKPFTLKSLAADLKTTESQLNFLMLSLVDKQLVIKKEFTSKGGKAKELYWVNYEAKTKDLQVSFPTPAEINATKKECDQLQQEKNSLQKMLDALYKDGPSNEELTERLEREESELAALRKNIEDLKDRIKKQHDQDQSQLQRKSLLGPKKTPEQLAKERCPRRMKIRINNMRESWKKRKEQCVDFIEVLADGMEKKPKDVIKLLDLETDEMVGVTIPPKHVIKE